MADLLRIMTVCTGNICRSPMAEVVLRDHLDAAGFGQAVNVDSSAVTAYEIGNPIDRRARAVLLKHGYEPGSHRARQIDASDLARCDLILPMTFQHASELTRLARSAGVGMQCGEVRLYRSFDPECVGEPDGPQLDIADPWYGGRDDFELVINQLETGVPGIVGWVEAQLRRLSD